MNNCTDKNGGWALGCRIDGGQAEYVRVPFADQGLNKIPDSVTDRQALLVTSKDILVTSKDILVLRPRFSSSGGKMEHAGRTLCVPLGYEDDGAVYTDCSQFSYFPDSRMKHGILICLSTAVKKLQDLRPIFAIFLQFSEILAVRRSFSGNFQPFPHFFP